MKDVTTRLHDIHVIEVPNCASGCLVGLFEPTPIDLEASPDDALSHRALQCEHEGGHPILPQDSEGDLADSSCLFQAGDEEGLSVRMHLTSCLENNR